MSNGKAKIAIKNHLCYNASRFAQWSILSGLLREPDNPNSADKTGLLSEPAMQVPISYIMPGKKFGNLFNRIQDDQEEPEEYFYDDDTAPLDDIPIRTVRDTTGILGRRTGSTRPLNTDFGQEWTEEDPGSRAASFEESKGDTGAFRDMAGILEEQADLYTADSGKGRSRNTSEDGSGSFNLRGKGKMTLYVLLAAACVLAAVVIAMIIKNTSDNAVITEEPENTEPVIATEAYPVTGVLHLSFAELAMYEAPGFISVDQFSQMLAYLYNNGYVLVDVYSLAGTDEEGNLYLNKEIVVPEGRKPLIISQRDVSYPLAKQNSAFAKRLVVDAGGNVRCEYVDETGNASMGDYDVIPIVDSFIRDHPDFSYNGARGIIGLTGYNGILGYRTSPYLASAESNPYGAFDVGSETMAMEVVLEVLEKEGWEFASNTFWDMSYGSEYSMVESDVNLWNEQVGALIGGTDLLIYAKGTDIASWAPYSDDDPKYALLKGSGFKYFMVNEKETPGFLQVEDDYMRQAIYDINTYEDFESAVTG